jgi:hypothetical protein
MTTTHSVRDVGGTLLKTGLLNAKRETIPSYSCFDGS